MYGPLDIYRHSGDQIQVSLTHLPLNKMAAILADDIFKCIFLNEKFCTLIRISLKFVPRGPISNKWLDMISENIAEVESGYNINEKV